jgi:predicted kinase
MIKVEMLVGIPGSGKSTYAKQVVAKDPNNWVRVNNDDLRAMMNGNVWSADYEKMVTDARNYLIRDALKRGKNVIIDNLNLNRRHFDDVCKIAKSVNADIQVFEKAFYVELDEAMVRNAARTGAARVPDEAMKKWWKESGGKQFKFYKPRVEIYKERQGSAPEFAPPVWHDTLKTAVLCDLDGTLALIHNRSPYDATDCDVKDLPNWPVIETIIAHYNAGRKIIFCSGREDKHREATIRFIEKYCLVDGKPIEYELYMRKTDDFRKDSIIKEEIYQQHIANQYNVLCVLDDRDQVVEFWRRMGLACFQVAPGNF